MSDVKGNFYMLNIKSKNDPKLTLNSIELLDSMSVFYFSYEIYPFPKAMMHMYIVIPKKEMKPFLSWKRFKKHILYSCDLLSNFCLA